MESPVARFLLPPPQTDDFIASVSNTNTTTLDFLVPRPSVSVCHAWCARIVKFVGRYAAVERSGGDDEEGRERSFRSSSVLARRIVNDLTIIWPPNLRPFTSEVGLKEMSED
ncbi:unnamed protein product [Arabidopsis arenosa]|uniref:Uncharacterized protein n=1 Tax=Arabidopsis arenosa TaxID=38785 RepID=A0A8S2ABX1_ARAAE|nr:unnamed protein product [Arabidopsis arenosa]